MRVDLLRAHMQSGGRGGGEVGEGESWEVGCPEGQGQGWKEGEGGSAGRWGVRRDKGKGGEEGKGGSAGRWGVVPEGARIITGARSRVREQGIGEL